jgi:hypothetical protein
MEQAPFCTIAVSHPAAAPAYADHVAEKKVILEGVFRAVLFQLVRDLARGFPVLRLLGGPAETSADLENIRV